MTATLGASPKFQAFDANGDPLVGGKVYTYAAGTTTPLATYTDQTAAVENFNPTILDARGEASIWYGASAYKVVLKDSLDNTIYTVDKFQGNTDPGSVWVYAKEIMGVACSDEASALSAGPTKVTFHMPYGFTLTNVVCGLSTAQTSGSIFTVDLNAAGSTVLSTKVTIDNGEDTSLTAVTPPVLSTTVLAAGTKMTVDIDTIGDGTAKGLKIYLIGYRTPADVQSTGDITFDGITALSVTTGTLTATGASTLAATSVTSLTSSGAVSGTTGTFSGAVSTAALTASGLVTATAGGVKTNTVTAAAATALTLNADNAARTWTLNTNGTLTGPAVDPSGANDLVRKSYADALVGSASLHYTLKALGQVSVGGAQVAGAYNFTSTNVGTGHYTITLTSGCSSTSKMIAMCTVLPGVPTRNYTAIPVITSTSVIEVYTGGGNSYALQNLAFNFELKELP